MKHSAVVALCSGTLLIAGVTPCQAQSTSSPGQSTSRLQPLSELGIRVGVGDYGYADDQPGPSGLVGAEFSLGRGTRTLFADYASMSKQDASYNTGYRRADMVTTGLRLRKRRDGAQPYFEIGVAIGTSRYQERSAAVDTLVTTGAALGVGVIIPKERFFFRIGAQLMVMSQYYLGSAFSLGAGWRF